MEQWLKDFLWELRNLHTVHIVIGHETPEFGKKVDELFDKYKEELNTIKFIRSLSD